MPMKSSSAPGGAKPIDRPTAWACTITNAVTLPGLGTVAGGRKIGYLQAALALLGFGMSLLWMGGVIRDWMASGEFPEGVGPWLLVGLGGICIYGVAWFWALGSSLSLLQEAKKNEHSGGG